MKQIITIEQFNELSQSGKQRLREYKLGALSQPLHDSRKTGPFKEAVYHAQLPITDYLLSIIDMLEFLDKKNHFLSLIIPVNRERGCQLETAYDASNKDYLNERTSFSVKDSGLNLCDTLWSAVKEVLEN
mgnify:FL=1